jgi:hypothetical protein
LRTIDRKYSTLIDQTVPTLNELQTLTAVSMAAMHNTSPTLFDTSPEGIQHAHGAIESDRALRGKALERKWLALKPNERKEFRDAGDAFTRGALEVVALIESGRSPEANQLREQSLRPVFHRYVESTTKTADILEADSLKMSDTLTEKTGNFSHVMLGIGGWPVVIVGLFFLTVIVFVAAVLLRVSVFPGAEA